MKKRTCGECSMCCKLIKIEEISKPAGEWCQYCAPRNGGCTIHGSHPQACKQFQCHWLKGLGSESIRPDKSKVIFLKRTIEDNPTIVVLVDPTRPDAYLQGEVWQIIRGIIKEGRKVMLGVGESAYEVRSM